MASSLSKKEARTVTILGSTGSIGCNTIDLLSRYPDSYDVVALTANQNIDLLARQAWDTNAQMAVTADEKLYLNLKEQLLGSGIAVAAGPSGIEEAAELSADFVMAGIVGAAGLAPTLKAIKRGAIVGLANKECLVCAGDLMISEVAKSGATLLPVDSEHNAIFQVFDFNNTSNISRIILTASGGPFRDSNLKALIDATPEQAVAHPNWDMGAKISVDSATMMNKGLEMIEAFYLFPISKDQIEIVIHPESVIHSLVEYIDGSVLAQLGSPDMRTPIAYALAWPERIATPTTPLDLASIGSLNFQTPNLSKFPCLQLATEALQKGASSSIILNAANEVAVHGFLQKQIGFMDIPKVVEKCMAHGNPTSVGSIKIVEEIDKETRAMAKKVMNNL